MITPQSIFSEKQRQLQTNESPTPLYFQLYTLLKNCILDGTIAKNMKLPTEKQLSDEFNVSRITAKRALDELAEDKLVKRQRGRGTHVIYEYKPRSVSPPIEAVLKETGPVVMQSKAIILDASMLIPPRLIRDEFDINRDEKLLYLARVKELNGLRFAYFTSWTPNLKLPGNLQTLEDTPRSAYIRGQGIQVSHVSQKLNAVSASPKAAETLGVEPGSPLLSLLRRSYHEVDGRETLTDYLLAMFHPDHFQYRMDFNLTE